MSKSEILAAIEDLRTSIYNLQASIDAPTTNTFPPATAPDLCWFPSSSPPPITPAQHLPPSFSPIPHTTHSTSLLPIRRLSPSEIEEKNDRGLCYNCDQTWSDTHRCRSKFLILFGTDDEDDFGDPKSPDFMAGVEATVEDVSSPSPFPTTHSPSPIFSPSAPSTTTVTPTDLPFIDAPPHLPSKAIPPHSVLHSPTPLPSTVLQPPPPTPPPPIQPPSTAIVFVGVVSSLYPLMGVFAGQEVQLCGEPPPDLLGIPSRFHTMPYKFLRFDWIIFVQFFGWNFCRAHGGHRFIKLLVGNQPWLLSSMWRAISTFSGATFLYSTGAIQLLGVTDAEMVKEMILCTSLNLGKPSYLSTERGPLLGRGILSSNGPYWAHQWKIIAPEFYLERVKGMVSLMVESTAAMLKSWETKAEDSGGKVEITVDEDFRSLSADIISRACFGRNYVQGGKICSMVQSLQRVMSRGNIGVPGMRHLPTKHNRELWRLERDIDSMILDAVKSRSSDDDGDKFLRAEELRTARAAEPGCQSSGGLPEQRTGLPEQRNRADRAAKRAARAAESGCQSSGVELPEQRNRTARAAESNCQRSRAASVVEVQRSRESSAEHRSRTARGVEVQRSRESSAEHRSRFPAEQRSRRSSAEGSILQSRGRSSA